MSSLAAALSHTVAKLADHEARASTGEQPQSAVNDVRRARQLVVRTQIRTLRLTESESDSRRKRSVSEDPQSTTPTVVIARDLLDHHKYSNYDDKK